MAGVSTRAAVDQGDEETSPPTRRQKIAAACDQCRLKKTKCDGKRPVCEPCALRSGSLPICQWTRRKGRGTAVATKTKLLQLAQRIEELEAEKRKASSKETAGNPITAVTQSEFPLGANAVISTGTAMQIDDDLALIPQQRDTDETLNQQPFAASPGSDSSKDDEQGRGDKGSVMMGFNRNVNGAARQPSHDSSVTSFVDQIRHLVDREASRSRSSASSPKSSTQLSPYPESSRRQALLNYNLPSRQRADHLLLVYRQLVATLYPILDLEEFETRCLRLWTGKELGYEGLTFVCLVNVVFSLACSLDTSVSPQQRVSDAETFYNRADELAQLHIVREPSLSLVQCYLLLGLYLQSSNDPERCWTYVGLAIRVAQSLRIHVPSTSAEGPEHQRELTRRTWYGCVLMDQVLSMTFGRPSTVSLRSSASVPLPLPHPNGAHCQCSAEPENDITDFHFYVETLKLYRLMHEILLLLYDSDAELCPNGDSNSTYFGALGVEAAGSLLELGVRLRSWSRNLPVHLRHNTVAGRHRAHERQANVLLIRYNHVRILLFRSVFAGYCSSGVMQDSNLASKEYSLVRNIALQFSIACVQAALDMIQSFDTIVGGRKVQELDDLLPAWWYSIFYVYTAGMVLIAARLDDSLLKEVTEQAICEGWVKAMGILKQYAIFSKHAKRCSTTLYLLSSLVTEQIQQRMGHEERSRVELRSNCIAPGGQEIRSPNDDPTTIKLGVHTQDWRSGGKEFEKLHSKTTTVENLLRHFNTSGIQVKILRDIVGDVSWINDMPSRQY